MTRLSDQILAMPAGPGIDGVVAERVLGWTDLRFTCGEWYGRPPKLTEHQQQYERHYGKAIWPVPSFSTDIAAAWQLVEFAYRRGAQVAIDVPHPAGWRCCYGLGRGGSAVAGTAPLAVCQAALVAVLQEQGVTK